MRERKKEEKKGSFMGLLLEKERREEGEELVSAQHTVAELKRKRREERERRGRQREEREAEREKKGENELPVR